MRFILVALFGMAAFNASAADQAETLRCMHFGGMKEKVCAASFFSLTTRPSRFYGRSVAVSGFVKVVEGKTYLFPSKEFADNVSMADALILGGQVSELKGKHGSWVTLVGAFRPLENLDQTDDLFRPVARLTVQIVQ